MQEQLRNAKEEVGKPFPKEAELNEMLERLSELNALLNMDEKEEQGAPDGEKSSIHDRLNAIKKSGDARQDVPPVSRAKQTCIE
jgi:hypothetical protein